MASYQRYPGFHNKKWLSSDFWGISFYSWTTLSRLLPEPTIPKPWGSERRWVSAGSSVQGWSWRILELVSWEKMRQLVGYLGFLSWSLKLFRIGWLVMVGWRWLDDIRSQQKLGNLCGESMALKRATVGGGHLFKWSIQESECQRNDVMTPLQLLLLGAQQYWITPITSIQQSTI